MLLLFLHRGCVMSRIVCGGFGFPSAFGIAEGWHVDVDWANLGAVASCVEGSGGPRRSQGIFRSEVGETQTGFARRGIEHEWCPCSDPARWPEEFVPALLPLLLHGWVWLVQCVSATRRHMASLRDASLLLVRSVVTTAGPGRTAEEGSANSCGAPQARKSWRNSSRGLALGWEYARSRIGNSTSSRFG